MFIAIVIRKVGSPTRRAENPRPYDGCRTLNFGALVPLAPAGRHVYSNRDTQIS